MVINLQALLPKSEEDDINSTFSKVIMDRKRNIDKLYERKGNKKPFKKLRRLTEQKPTRDTENYIPYHSSDKNTEDGLAINSFERQAQQAELSISQNDNTQDMHYRPGQKKWDRIKKKMVAVENPKNGKIRTESGIWIPATYKTGRYADWKEKTKTEDMIHQDMGLEGIVSYWKNVPTFYTQTYICFAHFFPQIVPKRDDDMPTTHWKRHNLKMDLKKRMQSGEGGEIKAPEQIVRERLRLEMIKNRERVNKRSKDSNRKRNMKNIKRKQKFKK